MGKRTTRRNSRRRMHVGGSMFDWFTSSDPSKSTNAVYDSSNNLVNSVYDTGKSVGSSAVNAGSGLYGSVTNFFTKPAQPTQPAQLTPSSEMSAFGNTAGGRRRRTKIKMRGVDFSPNSPFTNAMEVKHIQTAPPQTLVGGRRRRKSSRRSRRRRRRSSRRH